MGNPGNKIMFCRIRPAFILQLFELLKQGLLVGIRERVVSHSEKHVILLVNMTLQQFAVSMDIGKNHIES